MTSTWSKDIRSIFPEERTFLVEFRVILGGDFQQTLHADRCATVSNP